MIQRIQSFYMLIIFAINFLLIFSVEINPNTSISENYFIKYSHEIISSILLLNIFLFRYQKIQLFVLKTVVIILIFGLFNFFDERSIIQSLTDLGLFYFIISFILIYLSHKAIGKDKSIIDSSNRLR